MSLEGHPNLRRGYQSLRAEVVLETGALGGRPSLWELPEPFGDRAGRKIEYLVAVEAAWRAR